MRIIPILILSVLAVSCGPQEETLLPESIQQPAPVTPIEIEPGTNLPDGSFALKSMNSSPYQGIPVTLKVSSGRISGKGPVNRYNAELVSGSITTIAMTKMAGTPELMKLESTFIQLLQGADLSITNEGNLAARKNGTAVLIFQPATR